MKRKVLLIMFSCLVISSMFFFTAAVEKQKAYVFVGDVSVGDNGEKKRADVNNWAAEEARKNYKEAGYDEVVIKPYATMADLEAACKDPNIKALTIISHGWKKKYTDGKQTGFVAQMVDGMVVCEEIKEWLAGKTLNEVVIHACDSYLTKDSVADTFGVKPKNVKTWDIPILPSMAWYWELLFHSTVKARPDKTIDRTSAIPFIFEGTYTVWSSVPRGVGTFTTYLKPDPRFGFNDGFTLHLMFDIAVNTPLENATFSVAELTEDPVEINATNALPRYFYLVSDLMFIEPSPIVSLYVQIYYTDEEVIEQGFNESNLKLSWYNEAAGEYQVAENSYVSTVGNYVRAEVSNFGIFSITNE